MAKNTKPAIRFKGFTDAWEQRKLGEVIRLNGRIGFRGYTEKDIITKEEGGILTFSPTNIVDNKLTTRCKNTYITRFKYDESPEIKVHNGDILFVKTGSTLGKRALISGLSEEATLNPQVVVMRTPSGEEEFLSSVLITENISAQVTASKIGGAVPTLTETKIKDFDIAIPKTKEERKQIGSYFNSLDHLITLHQRKYDSLVNVKKAMLEKMFPKNGETVPEIRFKGFTDAWEQRKLGELTEKVTEKNLNTQYVETFTNSAEFGIISQREFFDHSISKMEKLDGYYVVRNEDFVYNPRISVTAPVGPINRNKTGRIGVMSPLYTVFRPHDVDNTYLEHFFKSKYWHSFMNFNGDSGARSDRFSIKDNMFFQMPIPTPDMDEQKKIGKYLTNLDHLITLHQRKLEKLKNIKKSCLEKMFV